MQGGLYHTINLLQKVWGYEYRDEAHYVRLYVNYLREKIEEDPSNPRYIITERGVGYRFINFKQVIQWVNSNDSHPLTHIYKKPKSKYKQSVMQV